MTLVQNCITSLLDCCNGPPVSMAAPVGHPPVYSQTALQKYQSQIPAQGLCY